MIKIGLAEDDVKISNLIKTGLQEHGYKVTIFSNGNEALQGIEEETFDLLILDILMPGLNGVEISKKLRESSLQLPILMLTAMGTIEDKVIGFNAGADDYLVKPFHFKELLLRIEALLRRNHPHHLKAEDHILSFSDVTLNITSKEVHRAGILIELTAKEFTLLELFLRNPKRLLSRQYIAEKVWDINFDTGTNVIDVYINFLRNKLEKGFDKKLIHTKINMGYILK